MKSDIEQNRFLSEVVISWWKQTNISHRESWFIWHYLHGLFIGFITCEQFHLAEEITFLRNILEQKINIRYMESRGLQYYNAYKT